MRKFKFGLIYFVVLVVCVLGYQNCGAPQHLGVTQKAAFYSGSCESPLMNAFGATYYPTFKAKCARCHENGPGIGFFANNDFQVAFNAFNSLGRARVERNLLNPNHQTGITGPENQPLVDRSLRQWTEAEEEFRTCAQQAGQDNIPGQEILTLHKADPTIVQRARNANSWVTLTWDLENEMALGADRGKYLLVFSIEVRVAIMGGLMRGYEFRNPTVRLKSNATIPYRMTKILFSLNQNVLYDVTTFSQTSAHVVSTTNFNIAPNSGLALAAHEPVLPTDSFAVAFGTLRTETGNIGGGDPAGGGSTGAPMPPPLPTSVTHTQLVSTDLDLGVFRRACINCHSGASARAGLDLTNYSQSFAARADIVQRMNNSANPMPPAGLLSERDRGIIQVWQNGGARQ